MAASVHRVRKQTWRVSAASAQEAFAARVVLRAQLEDELPGAFERAFEQAAPGQALVRIPRLELRVRVARLEDLRVAVENAIGHEIARAPEARRVAAGASRLETLERYLETGTLPWHAAHEEAAAAAAQLQATLLAHIDEILRRVPGAGIPRARSAEYLYRLLELLPDPRRTEVAERLAGARMARVRAALRDTQGGPAGGRHEALMRCAVALADTGTQEVNLDVPTGQAAAPAEGKFALIASHAGLVLLHPFLPVLFEACSLQGSVAGLAGPALARAAALLHWLATGREEIHEFELGLVKILLGLAPETALPIGRGLLEARDREEGAALLRAVLEHWRVLKGTSIEGLRLSFLQRRGALRNTDAGWRLQPESEPFDMLLEHLPWSFVTVKLPWMTRPLFTDWSKR
jgi:hypothetical protein